MLPYRECFRGNSIHNNWPLRSFISLFHLTFGPYYDFACTSTTDSVFLITDHFLFCTTILLGEYPLNPFYVHVQRSLWRRKKSPRTARGFPIRRLWPIPKMAETMATNCGLQTRLRVGAHEEKEELSVAFGDASERADWLFSSLSFYMRWPSRKQSSFVH